jgi:hypothetical protein
MYLVFQPKNIAQVLVLESGDSVPSTVQCTQSPLYVRSNLGFMLSILKKDKGVIIPIVKVFFSDVQNEACS